MGGARKRRFPSIIEALVDSKVDIQPATAATLRTDAAVILEALVAEFSEPVVLAALRNHGLAADAYRSTLVALAGLARGRRGERRDARAAESEARLRAARAAKAEQRAAADQQP